MRCRPDDTQSCTSNTRTNERAADVHRPRDMRDTREPCTTSPTTAAPHQPRGPASIAQRRHTERRPLRKRAASPAPPQTDRRTFPPNEKPLILMLPPQPGDLVWAVRSEGTNGRKFIDKCKVYTPGPVWWCKVLSREKCWLPITDYGWLRSAADARIPAVVWVPHGPYGWFSGISSIGAYRVPPYLYHEIPPSEQPEYTTDFFYRTEFDLIPRTPHARGDRVEVPAFVDDGSNFSTENAAGEWMDNTPRRNPRATRMAMVA